jgi:hypothetical protein
VTLWEAVVPYELLDTWVFPITVLSTFWMLAIIWFVQIVHYPLFQHVGENAFSAYHNRHEWWTTWIVGPPMFLEATGSFYLYLHPPFLEHSVAWGAGFLLVLVPLTSTAFLQVPQHSTLRDGYHPETIRSLVRWNWIRTAAWTMRGGICIYLLVQAMTRVSTQ